MTDELKRWPDMARVVPSDDLVIERAGLKYYPHKGEWVKFSEGLSMADMRLVLRFAGLRELDTRNPKTSQDYDELFGRVCTRLSEAVLDWNWTGPDGVAYENPHGKPDAIEALLNEEFTWLLTQYQAPAAVPKN